MEITTTTIHQLKWDFPDTNEFHAVISNGKITTLHFQDIGDLTDSDLCSTNEKYLRNICKALKELFQHLDSVRAVGNVETKEEEKQEGTHLNPIKPQIKSFALEKDQADDRGYEGKYV
ncbi:MULTISPECIES: hypothetical protein [Olivibacter]|jgi:hypothetical protein|uniref:Uncharacterized protein n=1 Tax=Olivibacter oleidegradans TaxID=760123 RepID=A0ABV6HMQ7_9SPHI|nr:MULTISPECIES: hypothetical protein [Olivibacter]MCL4641348.1 hypothetical protein [Olivibacter sp. UJ_SKK_5.1]MDM8175397.1 hypothetical protein [Olivibacter sp. 47]MDX3914010.1 hypothetical protein [Pseudosphingobacterium sp.]QEL02157.1 hypothetical protein FKG96_15525 [Olivibacter sp. LS-1]